MREPLTRKLKKVEQTLWSPKWKFSSPQRDRKSFILFNKTPQG